jgi:DNA-binding response OmpR family regulator
MISTWERSSVYLVDSATAARDALASGLALEGFRVDVFSDAESFQQALQIAPCDIAVLDILLDPNGGHGIVGRLRDSVRRMGIIVYSAITCLETRLECLESGADAYLVKPTDAHELAVQLRVLDRRLKFANRLLASDARQDWALIDSGWSLRDPAGNKLSLTTAERIFLRALFDRAGQPVPREELMVSLGADPRSADPHRLDVLVNRLRAKAQASGIALPVRSVRSRGYVLAVSANGLQADEKSHSVGGLGEDYGGALGVPYPAWE